MKLDLKSIYIHTQIYILRFINFCNCVFMGLFLVSIRFHQYVYSVLHVQLCKSCKSVFLQYYYLRYSYHLDFHINFGISSCNDFGHLSLGCVLGIDIFLMLLYHLKISFSGYYCYIEI